MFKYLNKFIKVNFLLFFVNFYKHIILCFDNSYKYKHNSNENNLYFVFTMFRHGARGPLWANETNHDWFGIYWDTLGKLTELGRQQHYEKGLANKEKYKNFINKEYDQREIQIFSTFKKRTIDSTQMQLLGLFSDMTYDNLTNTEIQNSEKLNIDLKGIIPNIHLFEINDYNLKYMKNVDNKFFQEPIMNNQIFCPKHRKKWKDNIPKEGYDCLKEFKDKYYKILKEKFSIEPINTFFKLSKLCDTFIADYTEKNSYDYLMKNLNPYINLKEFYDFSFKVIKIDLLLVRHQGLLENYSIIVNSNIMQKILNWMNTRININNNLILDKNNPKFVMYGGHDTTCLSMQTYLNKALNTEYTFPYFAFDLKYELRKYNNNFYVEIYYNDILYYNNTFDIFQKKIKSIMIDPQTVLKECSDFNQNSIDNSIKIEVFILIIILTLILFLLIKDCLKNSFNYISVPKLNLSPNSSPVITISSNKDFNKI